MDKEAPVFDECGYIIKEAVFMYWQNLWLYLKMEPIMIFMMPPSGAFINVQNMFGPSKLHVLFFFLMNSKSNLVIHQYGS